MASNIISMPRPDAAEGPGKGPQQITDQSDHGQGTAAIKGVG